MYLGTLVVGIAAILLHTHLYTYYPVPRLCHATLHNSCKLRRTRETSRAPYLYTHTFIPTQEATIYMINLVFDVY